MSNIKWLNGEIGKRFYKIRKSKDISRSDLANLLKSIAASKTFSGSCISHLDNFCNLNFYAV